MSDAATDVGCIAEAPGIERLGVWGFSGGGSYALACAALLPDLVTGAAVFASFAPYGSPGLDFCEGWPRESRREVDLFFTDPSAARDHWRKDAEQYLAACATPDGWMAHWGDAAGGDEFLEAAIARCAYDGGTFESDSTSVAEVSAELIAVLDSKEYTLHCCRAVSHITTAGPEPVRIGGVTIYPEAASRPRDLARRAHGHVPGIATAFSGDVPFLYGPPHALLVSSTSVLQGNDPDEARYHASAAIDRFMLLARLLHAGTHRSGWQVTGAPTLIAPIHPQAREFAGVRLDMRLQRAVHLSAEDAPAFAALNDYIDSAVVKRDGMTTTSFDTALHRYNRAHEEGSDFERIVDLATALEAVLTGDDKGEGLSLRLKSRAAALLATPTDSGTVIYNDITKLYDLRSRLIHGGSMSEKDFRKLIMGISTVPDDAMFGVALAFAVDRMRDLVRRSFLARLCLASGTTPLWPFAQSTPVDAALADDTTRTHWRNHWHDQLTTLGAAAAADPATPGTDPITRRSTA